MALNLFDFFNLKDAAMPYKNILLILTIVCSLLGCANTPMSSQSTSATSAGKVQALEGAPLPAGAVIDNKKSIIFGEGELWTGRVEVNSKLSADEVTTFFINQYPPAGWTFLSSTKSQTNILIFLGKNKTLTAEVQDNMLGNGSKITITVSPSAQK
jgi:hypothetical protein